MNVTGQSVVAWLGAAGSLWVRRGGENGTFAAPQSLAQGPISPGTGLDGIGPPAVSIAPDGTAAVGWARTVSGRHSIAVSVAGPTGSFGPAQTLASKGVPSVALVASSGRIVAVWDRGATGNHAVISYAIAGASGRFGPARALATPTTALPNTFPDVSLAADQAGDVILAYRTAPSLAGPANSQLAGAALGVHANAFSAPTIVSAATAHALRGSEVETPVAAAGPGGVAVGYQLQGTRPWLMQVASVENDEAFAIPRTAGKVAYSPQSSGEMTLAGPVVAVPASGGETAAWTVGDFSPGQAAPRVALYAATQTPGGTFGPAIDLTRPSTNPTVPLAAATTDLSILVWDEFSPSAHAYTTDSLDYTVRANTAGFTPPRTISSNPVGASEPRNVTALAAAGNHAIIAWTSAVTKNLSVSQLNG
jgi:hypothetical protein